MANREKPSLQLFEYVSKRLSADDRILQSHIALLSALYYYHDQDHPLGFFRCSRSKLMRHAHIRSTATYHKCLSELVQYQYLEYSPSWHPTKASSFRFVIVDNMKNHAKDR